MSYNGKMVFHLITDILYRLKLFNKTTDEIVWIGSKNGKYTCTWDEFFIKFAHVVYDANTKADKNLAGDLVIVFKDNTWLQRDPFTHWTYCLPPTRKSDSVSYDNILGEDLDLIMNLTDNDYDNLQYRLYRHKLPRVTLDAEIQNIILENLSFEMYMSVVDLRTLIQIKYIIYAHEVAQQIWRLKDSGKIDVTSKGIIKL